MNTALQKLIDRGFFKQCSDLEGLSRKMDEGPVTFYIGIDPTGPSLHVGHMVPVFALTHLQRAGHNPILLIGGGTARLGDPSGKTELRKMLSYEKIAENGKCQAEQLQSFVKFDGTNGRLVNNADWLADLNYIDFLREIGQHFSVNRMLSFEAYKQRMEHGLSFVEFNYQLLQSYDFLELYRRQGCQLQIGGDDQWGNIVSGIDLVRRVEGAEVFGLTFPLITRADGKKMGKSEKGAVFLDANVYPVYDFFQYWRNVHDDDVERFLKLFTFLPLSEIEELCQGGGAALNAAKERLAYEYTVLIHGKEAADKALEGARAAFGGSGALESMPCYKLPAADLEAGIGLLDLLCQSGLCGSKSDARRLVQQGGARVNDVVVNDLEHQVGLKDVQDGVVLLRAGKKKHLRVESE